MSSGNNPEGGDNRVSHESSSDEDETAAQSKLLADPEAAAGGSSAGNGPILTGKLVENQSRLILRGFSRYLLKPFLKVSSFNIGK